MSPAWYLRRLPAITSVILAWACTLSDTTSAADEKQAQQYRVRLTLRTALEFDNVPLDPVIDFGGYIRTYDAASVLDPNSIEVWNVATGKCVPHARSSDFSHSDRGRIEFLVRDRRHTEYEIRFRSADRRPGLRPQRYVPPIGNGDLLRYNAGQPKPVTLFYAAAFRDLNGDGLADLLGAWNYAYRPGEPWDGLIAYGRVGDKSKLEFGDPTQLRYRKTPDSEELSHFQHIYTSADFDDFNHDGLIDLVWCRRGAHAAEFFLNTGQKEPGGMPVFAPAGQIDIEGWEACRAVDLNGDGAMDVVVDGQYVRNQNPNGWPFEASAAVKLDAGRRPCFLDVDGDHRLDAVCLRGGKNVQPDFYRIGWRRNLGGDPPRFAEERDLPDIDLPLCTMVSAYRDGEESGLIVQHDAFQQISFYALDDEAETEPGLPRFRRRGRAESISAVLSLSDQAWPCLCDWDDDGDLDLLVGGGYGWPRIVINTGTRESPAYAEPRRILSEGQPIRFVRNEILGPPANWHDMGYPFPVFVDWDGDGLSDLVCANETNRIFWFRNIGTKRRPQFGARRQIVCDGYPDSSELRALSARRALDPQSNNGVYPYEPEQPFFWRTAPAFADWNGDGLLDFITHDGHTRVATLFIQYRDEAGALRLEKKGVVKLADGRPIDDKIVNRKARWTESFRAVDWDGDGLQDLIYSVAGAHSGTLAGGSIYLLRNVGSGNEPVFSAPEPMRCFGEPIRITNHGPHPWAGDFDGDGLPDLIACVEWSVYPFYRHAALTMRKRPAYELRLVKDGE